MLATLPVCSLLLALTSRWAVPLAVTKNPHKHLWGQKFFCFSPFCFPSPMPNTVPAPGSCHHNVSPIWWHFHSLAREGQCVRGCYFGDFQVKPMVRLTCVRFCLLAFPGSRWRTTPLFRGCKHAACGNLAMAQGTNEAYTC